MSEFKTLQFPNTARGQADKVAALQLHTAQGWRVVSETIVPGKFRGADACCFFLIFAPCAFLAGHTDDIITVTLERRAIPGSAGDEISYDRAKWNALVEYDEDVAGAAQRVRMLDRKWMDELAAAYLVLNDKTYLNAIVERVIARASAEEKAQGQLSARQEAVRRAEAEERQRRKIPYGVLHDRAFWSGIAIGLSVVIGVAVIASLTSADYGSAAQDVLTSPLVPLIFLLLLILVLIMLRKKRGR
jgi:hypothetical protein